MRLLNAAPWPVTVEQESLPPPQLEAAPALPVTIPAPHRQRQASLDPNIEQLAALPAAAAAAPHLDSNPAEEAIKGLVTGKTFLLETPLGSSIPILFRADGTMSGRAGVTLAGMLGASSDGGKWWVERGRLCQKWRIWFDKENQCLKLRQTGSTIHWTRDDGKSGTARISNK